MRDVEAAVHKHLAILAADRARGMKVPEGWKLVPMEPTLEMGWAYLEAARVASPHIDHAFNHPGYRAMLAAAPSTPPAAGQEVKP